VREAAAGKRHPASGRLLESALAPGPFAAVARVMPSRRLSFPASLAAALSVLVLASGVVAGDALAQTKPPAEPPATPLPPEYTEAARREYATGLAEARKLIADKRYEDAITRLDALSAVRPREAQARFLKAVAQADSGKSADAIATLRALSADFPELPEPRNNLAVLYAGQGNYPLARDELQLALAAAPDYAVAHDNLGDVYVRLAIDHYARAAALDKNPRTQAKLKLARELIAPPAP
jgi:tetratricopeptide (TPR) repeat protein